jgi:hypothetical protein
MSVSILKDISTELYEVAIKLKFYEGNVLTSYTSAIFFPVTQGGKNVCKYEID